MGGSTSAPTPVSQGKQYQSLIQAIQGSSMSQQQLDAQANPSYAGINAGAQVGASNYWLQQQQNNLVPSSAFSAAEMQNSSNSYMAQNAGGLENTYLSNNPALQAAMQGSLAMSGGGSYTTGATPGSPAVAASQGTWDPGTAAVAGQAATQGFGNASALPGLGANQQAIDQWWQANQGKDVTVGATGRQQIISGNAPNQGTFENYLKNAGWETGGGHAAIAAQAGTPGRWVGAHGAQAAVAANPGQTHNVGASQSLQSLMGTGNVMNRAGSLMQQYSQQLQQGSPLLQQQNLQAQQELATGGKLSNQEMTNIQQQTAGQFASSGMGGSSANIADQALSLEQAQNARLMQYQANASNVQGENTANAQAANAAAMVGTQDFSGAGSIFGAAGNLQNQANANLFSMASLMQSPLQNMQGSYQSAMNNYGTQAMSAGVNTAMNDQQISPQMIQQMGDYYNTQYNAQASAANANAAGQSATTGAAISGGAAIAAASATAAAAFS